MMDPEVAAKLESMTAMIEELRAELELMRRPKRFTMRQTGRCPSCDGDGLIHVPSVKDAGSHGPTAFALVRTAGFFTTDEFGFLEAFVCRSCRLVELAAHDPDTIPVDDKSLASEYRPGATERAAPDDGDPYR